MAGKRKAKRELTLPAYDWLMGGIAQLLEQSRHTAARTVNIDC